MISNVGFNPNAGNTNSVCKKNSTQKIGFAAVIPNKEFTEVISKLPKNQQNQLNAFLEELGAEGKQIVDKVTKKWWGGKKVTPEVVDTKNVYIDYFPGKLADWEERSELGRCKKSSDSIRVLYSPKKGPSGISSRSFEEGKIRPSNTDRYANPKEFFGDPIGFIKKLVTEAKEGHPILTPNPPRNLDVEVGESLTKELFSNPQKDQVNELLTELRQKPGYSDIKKDNLTFKMDIDPSGNGSLSYKVNGSLVTDEGEQLGRATFYDRAFCGEKNKYTEFFQDPVSRIQRLFTETKRDMIKRINQETKAEKRRNKQKDLDQAAKNFFAPKTQEP